MREAFAMPKLLKFFGKKKNDSVFAYNRFEYLTFCQLMMSIHVVLNNWTENCYLTLVSVYLR